MALSPLTPRDKLQRLVDLAGKTSRNWWVVMLFAVIGGALSLAFAMMRAPKFESWATVLYQERIQSAVMSQREEATQRNIADRYRELLLARSQLEKIIADPALNPFPDEPDKELAIDKLRQAVRFEAKATNVFRITYTDSDPDRARDVTAKLTQLLQDKEEQMRKQTATDTVKFVTAQKQTAEVELRDREHNFAAFLTKHPEFVQDPTSQGGEGGLIRAGQKKQQQQAQNASNVDVRLQRQKERIIARLNAPPDKPVKIIATPSPERQAAEAAVNEAQQAVQNAKRDLEALQAKGLGEMHPDLKKAQARLTDAKSQLLHAQSNVPSDIETVVAPASAEDRAQLTRQLDAIESQIAAQQKGAKPANDNMTAAIAQLETEHTDLKRKVDEQREMVSALADSVFRAQMTANQQLAEEGARLSILDSAFKPVKPTGAGKTIFLAAGLALFLALGLGGAVGLAVIDDRLYRRADIDQLGFAVLAVIPRPGRSPKKGVL